MSKTEVLKRNLRLDRETAEEREVLEKIRVAVDASSARPSSGGAPACPQWGWWTAPAMAATSRAHEAPRTRRGA